jgi:hypothetical protein
MQIRKILIQMLGEHLKRCYQCKSVFGSVVAGAFQITFRAKMHANDVFFIF